MKSSMGHLLEILLDLLNLPSWNSRNNRSIVGESEMEKQTRLFGRIFYGFLVLVAVIALIWYFCFKS